jgi:hypothetical protein
MRIDGVAQVGRDAFADPAHHVEAQRGEQTERGANGEQRQEMAAQRHHARRGVGGDQAAVDQRFQRDRQHECARRGHEEEEGGQRDLQLVRPQEGPEAGEGARAVCPGPFV